MSPVVCESGYLRIRLQIHGRDSQYYVHRLVLLVFKGPPPPGMDGAHNNGMPADCRLSNLRWDTVDNNHADKLRHGTQQRGVACYQAKLDDAKVRLIRASAATSQALSEQLGVSAANIRRVRKRIIWKHVL